MVEVVECDAVHDLTDGAAPGRYGFVPAGHRKRSQRRQPSFLHDLEIFDEAGPGDLVGLRWKLGPIRLFVVICRGFASREIDSRPLMVQHVEGHAPGRIAFIRGGAGQVLEGNGLDAGQEGLAHEGRAVEFGRSDPDKRFQSWVNNMSPYNSISLTQVGYPLRTSNIFSHVILLNFTLSCTVAGLGITPMSDIGK